MPLHLHVGEAAPPFEAPSTEGVRFQLAGQHGRPVVLFFYPKDFSPLCTMEVCSFRDDLGAWEELGVTVLGISDGTPAMQQAFRARHHLNFHLLSDSNNAIRRKYGVMLPLGLTRRVSYLLTPAEDGHRVAEVFEHNFSGKAHAEAMRAALAKWNTSANTAAVAA